MNINQYLDKNKEDSYKEFSIKLAPTINPKIVLGVRVPKIRQLAKLLSNQEKEEFITKLPHQYHEENLLHGFILSSLKDFSLSLKSTNEFLPYVDNWMVSDTMTPKIFKKHKKELYPSIIKWISSKKTYYVRFAICVLMDRFLDEQFEMKDLNLVSSIKSSEYYVNMAIAWYISTALAKHYDEVVKLIEAKKLDKWVHNKAIQKAIESNRISDEQKQYLRTLKI